MCAIPVAVPVIIPAIDLKDGKCVRLKQGRMEDNTVFSDDPVAMAARWVHEGARRLHLVDLNVPLMVYQFTNKSFMILPKLSQICLFSLAAVYVICALSSNILLRV